MLIFLMIRTVHTAVYAIVGKIQRGKQNDSVSVEFFLDLRCQIIHILNLLRNGQARRTEASLWVSPLHSFAFARIWSISSTFSLFASAYARVSLISSSEINSSAFN